MQFDLFDPGHHTCLRNDVILALERDNTSAAAQALKILHQNYPDDGCLPALDALIRALHHGAPARMSDHAALDAAVADLQQLELLAQVALGSIAGTWLRQRWTALAQAAQSLPFCHDQPQLHAAPLWLRAHEWQRAADAVAVIESWRRIPVPLAWMLQARLSLQGVNANWGLLAELAWLAPKRLQTVLDLANDATLIALVNGFWQTFEGSGDSSDLCWLPAWLLTERPELASTLQQAQAGQHTAPEQTMRLLLELLGLERQARQRDLVDRRKTLRGLHPGLFAAYMARR